MKVIVINPCYEIVLFLLLDKNSNKKKSVSCLQEVWVLSENWPALYFFNYKENKK